MIGQWCPANKARLYCACYVREIECSYNKAHLRIAGLLSTVQHTSQLLFTTAACAAVCFKIIHFLCGQRPKLATRIDTLRCFDNSYFTCNHGIKGVENALRTGSERWWRSHLPAIELFSQSVCSGSYSEDCGEMPLTPCPVLPISTSYIMT